MNEKSVIIILSDKCVAECKVCYASCSPHNSRIISDDLMINIIKQVKEDKIAGTIGFSGGEPFIHHDLLKKGLFLAKKDGLKTKVYTNAFWGNWSDEELNEKIVPLPIDTMIVSTDFYHEQYVPETALKNSFEALKKAKITPVLRIGETKSYGADSYFQKLGNYKISTNLILYPFNWQGRAEELPYDEFYRLCETDNVFCIADGNISVRYDGELFPCSEFVTFDSSFSIGNIYKNRISEILEKNRNFMSVIQIKNKLGKIAPIIKNKFNISLPKLCGSGCEVCYMIFKDKEIRDYVNNGLVEYD